MRHKGIDNLVKAVDGTGLDVVGRVYDERYGDLLRRLAAGKDVRFTHGATDEDVARAYRNALVTVLPSVYRDCFGGTQSMPELLGRVLLESMACGTPVICTGVGGMPEIVRDGENGFVVPPNDPGALRAAIGRSSKTPAWLTASANAGDRRSSGGSTGTARRRRRSRRPRARALTTSARRARWRSRRSTPARRRPRRTGASGGRS